MFASFVVQHCSRSLKGGRGLKQNKYNNDFPSVYRMNSSVLYYALEGPIRQLQQDVGLTDNDFAELLPQYPISISILQTYALTGFIQIAVVKCIYILLQKLKNSGREFPANVGVVTSDFWRSNKFEAIDSFINPVFGKE